METPKHDAETNGAGEGERSSQTGRTGLGRFVGFTGRTAGTSAERTEAAGTHVVSEARGKGGPLQAELSSLITNKQASK